MNTEKDRQLTIDELLKNIEAAKPTSKRGKPSTRRKPTKLRRPTPTPKPGEDETAAEAMLHSIETARRLVENAKRQRSTKRNGYIGHVVV